MKRLILILILCSLWGIPGTVFAQDITTGTVRGQIREASQMEPPIEGVRVVITSVDGSEHKAETDTNGEFELTGLAPGRYLISIYKQGYRDREGKRLIILAGSDQVVLLKMMKNKIPIAALLIGFGIVLLLCVIVVAIIIGHQTNRPSD